MQDALVYVVEDNLCYGIIRLLQAYKVDRQEFKELAQAHQVTELEKNKWYPTKEVLFNYEFVPVELFDVPRKVNIEMADIDIFVENFEFLNEQEQLMIKGDIKKYDAEKLNTDVLKDDWRIVCAWYSSKSQGKETKHSLEDIINLGKLIYDELDKRGVKFHPDTMTPHAKDLYLKVSGQSTIDLNDPELLSELMDKCIIKDFISVVGSYAEGKKNPRDVDILIRMKEPTSYIKRAIETRFLKDVGFSNQIHFIWGDTEGPHDTFIPLYDLELKRITPLKIVTMQQVELAAIAPFFPMKPSHRFYEIEEIIPFMFGLANKFAIEKKYNGFRVLTIKTGELVKIYSEHKQDVTEHFPTIVHEIKSLTNDKDFIIDSELVYKEGGRAEIIKYFIGHQKDLDDSLLTLHVFDITYLDDKDISGLPWFERKDIVHNLHFTKHIQEVTSIIVRNKEEAEKAIKFTRNLKNSEGAMVKQYDAKYTKNGKSDAWIKFRNVDTINVLVIEVHKKENGNSYLVGIPIDDKAKFNPDYLRGNILVLGSTFVTTLQFKEKDHIIINIEEVWKHIYPKKKIRFSIHKPKVLDFGPAGLTKWKQLDDLAVSKGEAVQEFCQECQLAAVEVEVENHVVKRGSQWCVVHGHPQKPGSKTDKPPGTPIKCFATKEKAEAMHKAIIISEAKRAGKLQNYPVPETDSRLEVSNIEMAIPTDDRTRQYDFMAWHCPYCGAVLPSTDPPERCYMCGRPLAVGQEMAQPHNDSINSGTNRNYDPITGEQLDGEQGVTAPGGIRGGGTIEGDIADVQGKVWQKKKVIADGPTFNPIKPAPHTDNMPKHDKKPGLPPGLQDTFSGIGEKKTSNPLPKPVSTNIPPRLQPETTPVWWGLEEAGNMKEAVDEGDKQTIPTSEGLAGDKHHGSEGGEYMINDFPGRMQRNFSKIMEMNQWRPFTMQWHLRGTDSIHTDLRLDIGEHLEGFTLFTPGSMEGEDKLTEQPHNIRGTIKLPQPKEWLKVHGGFKSGQPGTTTQHNAYFAIIAKGQYRPVEISDHVIRLELASDHGAIPKVAAIADEDRDYITKFNEKLPENRKMLNGYFSFHIAHIEDRHIILFDKVHSS